MITLEKPLDSCISSLSHKFLKWPNNFFTESDAHSFLYYYIFRSGPKDLKLFYPTNDGSKTVLIHREYPTSFRFFKESMERDDRGGRGHYDLVVLNPEFIKNHSIKQVMAKDFKECCTEEKHHLLAAAEFKLITMPLSQNMKGEIKRDFQKLNFALESGQTQLAYMIIFNRHANDLSFINDLRSYACINKNIKLIYVESVMRIPRHYYCLYTDNWSEMLKFKNIEILRLS